MGFVRRDGGEEKQSAGTLPPWTAGRETREKRRETNNDNNRPPHPDFGPPHLKSPFQILTDKTHASRILRRRQHKPALIPLSRASLKQVEVISNTLSTATQPVTSERAFFPFPRRSRPHTNSLLHTRIQETSSQLLHSLLPTLIQSPHTHLPFSSRSFNGCSTKSFLSRIIDSFLCSSTA
jgi:hypothetical protein